jgi:hypothetical protein
MNKKYIIGGIVLSLLIPAYSHADTSTSTGPTIAILDTAIDTSIPELNGKIVYEACITEFGGCAGGAFQAEGPGSASLPLAQITKNGFDHGTQMAATAVQTNSNVKIVFVKIVGSNPRNGFRQAMSDKSVDNALAWVIANKSKFNIQAVAMSQGTSSKLGAANTDYCPKTPVTEGRIETLKSLNVPVFFPAGNRSDYSRIDWPACIPNAIATGAVLPDNSVAFYSNYDSKLIDFYSLGSLKVKTAGNTIVPIAGTSAANIVSAVNWATIANAKPSLSYQQTYDLISSTSLLVKSSKVLNGKLINVSVALNG